MNQGIIRAALDHRPPLELDYREPVLVSRLALRDDFPEEHARFESAEFRLLLDSI